MLPLPNQGARDAPAPPLGRSTGQGTRKPPTPSNIEAFAPPAVFTVGHECPTKTLELFANTGVDCFPFFKLMVWTDG